MRGRIEIKNMPEANANENTNVDINQMLLGVAGRLREAKRNQADDESTQRQRRPRQEYNTLDDLADDSAIGRIVDATTTAAKKGTTRSAMIEGMKLGFFLRKEINECRAHAFWIVLGICMFIDFFDIIITLVELFTGGLALAITKILKFGLTVAVWAMFVVFFMRKKRIKKYIIKRLWMRFIAGALAETLPITSIFPAYTIGCIMVKMSIDKRRKELEPQNKKVEKFNQEMGQQSIKLQRKAEAIA